MFGLLNGRLKMEFLPDRALMKMPAAKACHPLFSDEDADLRRTGWSLRSDGYAQTYRVVNGKSECYLSHRVVLQRMIGRPLAKGEVTDHINRNRMDNRRCNLRLADKSSNGQNRDKPSSNSSGFRNVWLRSDTKKWSAELIHKKKKLCLGSYATAEEASAVVEAKRKELGFYDKDIPCAPMIATCDNDVD